MLHLNEVVMNVGWSLKSDSRGSRQDLPSCPRLLARLSVPCSVSTSGGVSCNDFELQIQRSDEQVLTNEPLSHPPTLQARLVREIVIFHMLNCGGAYNRTPAANAGKYSRNYGQEECKKNASRRLTYIGPGKSPQLL